MSKNNIKKLFPKRKANSHKGDYGNVFILAGSDGMLGAAILCSRSALRSGVGLVHLSVPSKAKDLVNIATPEVIVVGGEALKDLSELINRSTAIVIGPGLGPRKSIARELLLNLSEQQYPHPVIVDADGLMAFKKEIAHFYKLGLNLVLTPHPGELGRMIGKSALEVQNDRKGHAVKIAKQLKCVLVLKGDKTIIADENGRTVVNNTGNPGMATAGSGDVLAGIIGGLAGQGYSAWDAAVAGVYLHGSAGDLAAKEKGEYGLIASDIIGKISYAIKQA